MTWHAWVMVTEGCEHGLWVGCDVRPPAVCSEVEDITWDTHALPCCREGGDTGTDSGCWLTDAEADDDWAQRLATLREAARRKAAGEHPIGLDRWVLDREASDVL